MQLTFAGVFGLLALVVWLPYLTRTRDVLLATPGPPPLRQVTPVALAQGGRTCVDGVTIDPALRTIRTRALAGAGPTAGPIDVVLLEKSGHVVGHGTIANGVRDPGLLEVPVTQSLRHSVVGSVCLVNHGGALTMQGSDEPRIRTRSNTIVNGTQVVGDMTLEMLGKPSSIGSRIGALFTRAATFKPVTPWAVWVLAILLVVGVPTGLLVVLTYALDRTPRPGSRASRPR